MADAKNLEFYLANPDEMPEDLTQLAIDLEKPVESMDANESAPSSAEPEAKAEDKPEEKAEETTPKLLSKNGKDEIPYQVLVSERERRAQAEKQAQELTQRLADLESRLAGKTEPEPQKQAEPSPVEDDAINKLAEDFPEVGAVIKALHEKVMFAEQKLAQVETQEAQRRMTEAEKVQNVVQEAIDANPALRYWQAEDPDMFAKAIEFDNVLRADQRNAHLPMAQRFERVVKTMEAAYGPVELPDTYKPEAKSNDMNELTEKAKKVVNEAGNFKPRSLSDIPGGTPPAASENAKYESMTPSQLASMMSGMETDQINALLAKLG